MQQTGVRLILHVILFTICTFLAVDVLAQTVSIPQVSGPVSTSSSDGAMDGVNIQRTNYYPGKSLERVNSVLWKSPKYFEINYAAAMTTSFDQVSLEVTNIGFSEPMIANGLLFFQLTKSPHHYYLFALDQSNGQAIWRFDATEPISSPAIAGDTVYIESTEGILYALDIKTGKERWRYIAKGEHWIVGPSPAVSDGVVYFSAASGSLYALDTKTRQLKWVYKTKGILTPATLTEDTVYIGAEKGFLYALDRASGQERWNFKVKGHANNPVFMDGLVYFRTDEGILYALDAKSGQEKWSTKVGGKYLPVFPVTSVTIGTALAAHDKTIFFAGVESTTDYLYAIDAKSGQQKWKFATKGPCRAPIATDEIVYIGCFGNFLAIDAQNGTKRWGIESKTEFHGKTVKVVPSSPALSNGTLYFLTDEGFVYALQ